MPGYNDVHLDSTDRILADLRVAEAECIRSSTRPQQFQNLFLRTRQKLEHLNRKLDQEKRKTRDLHRSLQGTISDWTSRYYELEVSYGRLQQEQAAQARTPEVSWCPGCVAQQASREEGASYQRPHRPYTPMASGAMPVPPRVVTPPPEDRFPSASFLRWDAQTGRGYGTTEHKRSPAELAEERDRLSSRFERRPGQRPLSHQPTFYPNMGVVTLGRY